MKRAILILSVILGVLPAAGTAEAAVAWQSWSPAVFSQAAREKKFVLLDLEAVWCHWCHVMDQQTYADPGVAALLGSHFIAVKVDQDSRPDLSNRYEDYGWPATIVFAADGSEIVKRSGFMPPDEMASMLKAIIADPSPGPSVVREVPPHFPQGTALPRRLQTELEQSLFDRYDKVHGSWGFSQKFLDWSSVEYSLLRAREGSDPRFEKMARQTLDAQLALLDPVWGGVYQYSTGGDWKEPHFEKIEPMQAENMRIYAAASTQLANPRYLRAALSIYNYLNAFLRDPGGAFYTSQNADVVDGQHSAAYFALDDAHRRKIGIPRVDRNIYARENGWIIQALVRLYATTGDDRILNEALTAGRWVIANLGGTNGAFRHGVATASNRGGPYLGDSLEMARAELALFAATGNRGWIDQARRTALFIDTTFMSKSIPGYSTAPGATPERGENVAVARFSNLLFRYTADHRFEAVRDRALRYLAAPEVAALFPTASVLLASLDAENEPLHVTVVGSRTDPLTRTL
ncbi:MAG TPA: DUF255 domain-containing protein, partial [Thermoanaerobaculia bacterium]|nr:DUF255 domain-containing protein [Thermoanaerobaculia bacterium]